MCWSHAPGKRYSNLRRLFLGVDTMKQFVGVKLIKSFFLSFDNERNGRYGYRKIDYLGSFLCTSTKHRYYYYHFKQCCIILGTAYQLWYHQCLAPFIRDTRSCLSTRNMSFVFQAKRLFLQRPCQGS